MAIAYMKRDPETAVIVEDALRIPEGVEWSDVEVTFATDETAVAKVTYLIDREQAARLAGALTNVGGTG